MRLAPLRRADRRFLYTLLVAQYIGEQVDGMEVGRRAGLKPRHLLRTWSRLARWGYVVEDQTPRRYLTMTSAGRAQLGYPLPPVPARGGPPTDFAG